MKILLVSDLHYRLRQFDWLRAAAAGVDVVAIAGDLLDIRSPVSLHVQAVAVSAALRALGTESTVLSASGNHDLDGRDANGEKAACWLAGLQADGVHGDGASMVVDDVLFTVCPWWDGPAGRAALGERLAADAAVRRRYWVWVHHAPPQGSPLAWDGRRAYGDEALREWITRFRPDLVLVGHVHQAPFVAGGGWVDRVGPTVVVNAGQQHGPVPAHVLLDLAAGTAVWTAAGKRGEVALELRVP